MNRSNTEKFSIDSGPRAAAAAGALRVKILRDGLVFARAENLTISFRVTAMIGMGEHQETTRRLRRLGFEPIGRWGNWTNNEAEFRRAKHD
jgi:hypothetical protein